LQANIVLDGLNKENSNLGFPSQLEGLSSDFQAVQMIDQLSPPDEFHQHHTNEVN